MSLVSLVFVSSLFKTCIHNLLWILICFNFLYRMLISLKVYVICKSILLYYNSKIDIIIVIKFYHDFKIKENSAKWFF